MQLLDTNVRACGVQPMCNTAACEGAQSLCRQYDQQQQQQQRQRLAGSTQECAAGSLDDEPGEFSVQLHSALLTPLSQQHLLHVYAGVDSCSAMKLHSVSVTNDLPAWTGKRMQQIKGDGQPALSCKGTHSDAPRPP